MFNSVALAPTLHLIGVASALGAPDFDTTRGSEAAPQVLRQKGILAAATRSGFDAVWRTTVEALRGDRLPALGVLLREVADEVAASVASGALPVVIGGDHSIAAGTWRGVGRSLGRTPGLIWIDAHLDANTPETSLSGNPHGMPLAALLGAGAPLMTDIDGPTLDAHHVAVIGARSFEPEEARLLATLGVTVFDMAEIRRRGLAAVFVDAREIAGSGGTPFGISIDLDAIDPLLAPGVATPVAGGLSTDELLLAIAGVLRQRQCVALEITEYCPDRDPLGITGQIAIDLLESTCASLR